MNGTVQLESTFYYTTVASYAKIAHQNASKLVDHLSLRSMTLRHNDNNQIVM